MSPAVVSALTLLAAAGVVSAAFLLGCAWAGPRAYRNGRRDHELDLALKATIDRHPAGRHRTVPRCLIPEAETCSSCRLLGRCALVAAQGHP